MKVQPPKNDELEKQKKVLHQQQKQISLLKEQIKKKKSELETTYHFEIIREKEDELKNLARIKKELITEKKTI